MRSIFRNNRRFFSLSAIYIALIIFSVWALFPIFWMALSSFKSPDNMIQYPPEWFPQLWTLENYKRMLTETLMPRYVLNSGILALGSIILVVSVSVSAGYGFARYKFPGDKFILIGLLAGVMIAGVTKLAPLYYMMWKLSLLNTYLALVLVYSAETSPIVIWLMRAYIQTIPKEIDEAGKIDGCNTMQIILRLILPLTWPALIAGSLLVFVTAWHDFLYAQTLMQSDTMKTIPVGIATFFTEQGINWSIVTSASTFITVPIIVFFLFMERHLIRGMTTGATD